MNLLIFFLTHHTVKIAHTLNLLVVYSGNHVTLFQTRGESGASLVKLEHHNPVRVLGKLELLRYIRGDRKD